MIIMINKTRKITWIMILALMLLFINPKNISSASATFDFSNSNSMDNVSLYAGELLTGEEIIESEEDYYRYEGAILKYDEKVPSNKVVTTLENSKLTIIANQYEYNDVNGNKVVWVPNYVELDGTKVNFNYSNGESEVVLLTELNNIKFEDKTNYTTCATVIFGVGGTYGYGKSFTDGYGLNVDRKTHIYMGSMNTMISFPIETYPEPHTCNFKIASNVISGNCDEGETQHSSGRYRTPQHGGSDS